LNDHLRCRTPPARGRRCDESSGAIGALLLNDCPALLPGPAEMLEADGPVGMPNHPPMVG